MGVVLPEGRGLNPTVVVAGAFFYDATRGTLEGVPAP
jgi:hypothetical protein